VKLLLLLYPRAWRERYQAEMEAVLDDVGPDLRTAMDLVGCAVDAHLNPRGGSRPLSRVLLLRVVLLAVLGMLAFSAVSWVERPLQPGISYEPWTTIALLAPVVVAGLAALVSWRSGWRLSTVFWAFAALESALGTGLMWEAQAAARTILEPVRAAVAGWHPTQFRLDWIFAVAAVAAAGALIAAFLRRLDVPWPAGLAIGVVLVGSAEFWTFWAVSGPDGRIWAGHPTWFRLLWVWYLVQAAPWAALAAMLLRRSGTGWPASLVAGSVLYLLLGTARFTLAMTLFGGSIPFGINAVIDVWQLPFTLWAAVLAVLAVREPTPAVAEPAAA
jgi:hypothetical protein